MAARARIAGGSRAARASQPTRGARLVYVGHLGGVERQQRLFQRAVVLFQVLRGQPRGGDLGGGGCVGGGRGGPWVDLIGAWQKGVTGAGRAGFATPKGQPQPPKSAANPFPTLPQPNPTQPNPTQPTLQPPEPTMPCPVATAAKARHTARRSPAAPGPPAPSWRASWCRCCCIAAPAARPPRRAATAAPPPAGPWPCPAGSAAPRAVAGGPRTGASARGGRRSAVGGERGWGGVTAWAHEEGCLEAIQLLFCLCGLLGLSSRHIVTGAPTTRLRSAAHTPPVPFEPPAAPAAAPGPFASRRCACAGEG
jgi:hypothetical protein